MNTNSSNSVNLHYARLLGLGEEWEVTRVALNLSAGRLDIYLDYAARAAVCPRCGALAGLHDRQPERTWRHLDAMQFATFIHARTVLPSF